MSNLIVNSTLDLSVIIPMYNREDVILGSLDSVLGIKNLNYEIIVVDDGSKDCSVGIVKEYSKRYDSIKIIELPENTGSPSIPRNAGMKKASGEYILFLDSDDHVVVENLEAACYYAQDNKFEMLMTPLFKSLNGGKYSTVDTLKLTGSESREELLVAAISQKSMAANGLFRREFILEYGVEFDASLDMGEDLLFTSEVIKCGATVGYIDKACYVYNVNSSHTGSLTSNLDSDALNRFVSGWERVQSNYLAAGFDFFELHGKGTISYGIEQIIKFGVVPNRESFSNFRLLLLTYANSVKKIEFSERISEVVDAVLVNNYNQFLVSLKPRLLIAGHDLKFILGAIPSLEKYFSVKVDEWESERTFVPEKSRELIGWAEYIWVEWMTAASEWYSANKRKNQVLSVRSHFYEIKRSSGFSLDMDKVDAIVAIALHTYEDMVEKFRFPRNKIRLIPNYYDVDAYRQGVFPIKLERLAFVGFVPMRKGLARALVILKELRKTHPGLTMDIYGGNFKDFAWVRSVPEEKFYYEACERYIAENNLGDAIRYPGFVDLKEELANYSAILSVSDFEGSHVAPGEAFCVGIPAFILDWRGSEYVYPEAVLCRSISEIVEQLQNLGKNQLVDVVGQERVLLKGHQDVEVFASRVHKLFVELAT